MQKVITVALIAMLGAPTGVFAEASSATTQSGEPRMVVRALAEGSIQSEPIRPSCQAQGSASVEAVCRAIASYGVGKTVDVTTASSKKLRAKIQSIAANGFTVTHGRTPVPLTITYDEVTQVKAAGWPLGAKIALAAGAAVGVGILIWLSNPAIGY